MLESISRTLLRNLLVCFVLPALLGASLWGQASATGTVSGQVTDPSGAVIPSATVTLTDTASHSALTTTSNESGRYVFVNVPPAVYDITVNKAGFAQAKISAQKVAVGLVLTANITMRVGAATEVINVEATGAQLQTTNATVGTTMAFDMAQALPGLSRDVSGLVLLQPATAPVGAPATGSAAGATAGSVADQNAFMLDGGNVSNDMDGNTSVYTTSFAANPITLSGGAIPTGTMPTPVDSIEEFKVGVIGQGADFNAAAGSQVAMVTRRGTNSWHGAANEYYYGTNFSANDWANGHAPSKDAVGNPRFFTPLPSRHQNRFGASAGGPILPFNFLGGKTYLFAFYQGVRYPNIDILEKPTPSDLLRAGVIQIQNSSKSPITVAGVTYQPAQWMAFNLNPGPVTVNGVTYQPANVCGAAGNQPCDPRGIGLNPIVNQIWSQWMPAGNDTNCSTTFGGGICDTFNAIGYRSSIGLPAKDNNWVFRIDHDFGAKWRFMSSYRYYKLTGNADRSQVDVGGLVGKGQKGQYVPLRNFPQYPGYLVAGLTTTINPRVTNDFRYNYLYNWWAWNGPGAPIQPIAGLGGAVEIGGELINALIPYNVNTQQSRTRFWDGQDHVFRDDLTWLKGDHFLQFGGSYQRNFNWHQRNDNGVGIMAANVYQVANNAGLNWSAFQPPSSILPSGQRALFQSLAAQVFGIVGQPQTLYTRAGSDLHLLPLGTPAFDKSVIRFTQGYFSDTWHMRPSFTLTYGLSYTLEMPPVEEAGKQVMMVDQNGKPFRLADYLASRKSAALAGQVFDPVVGFATVKNVAGGGRKYPYDPFYGGISPRLSAAWNPHFSSGILGAIFGDGRSVLRGGYSRIYGRLNGVDLVLVPLLGTGLLQPVSCIGASRTGQCLGTGGANPNTAFRIGVDGLTAPLGGTPSQMLPQPYFPGVGGNLPAGDGSVLDPNFRPNVNDTFTFSWQREVSSKVFVEAGYIGKLIHNEFQEINMDAVPYMTTLGGQTFASAFANLYQTLCGLNVQTCSGTASGTITPQPWFESAMGGPASAYCTGFASCTAAVVSRQGANVASNSVYDFWNGLAGASQTGWILGRTLPSSQPPNTGCPAVPGPTTVCRQLTSVDWNESVGYGSYHGLYTTLSLRDWHGATARSTFTWGRALGTGAEVQARSSRSVLDPWNLRSMYGSQGFDVKFVYNLALYYQPPIFRGQHGILGHILGGWSFSPLFTAQSGFPLRVTQTEGAGTTCQAFGQSSCSSTSSIYNAVGLGHVDSSSVSYLFTKPSGGVGTTATAQNQWLNVFGDPSAAYSKFRRLILGLDTRGNGVGIVRGLSRWNLDGTIIKDVHFSERFGLTFTTQVTNLLNHMQANDPTLNLDSPASFGRIGSTAYDSRQIELGLRLRW